MSSLDHRRHEIATAENNALLLVQSLAVLQEQIAIGTKQMVGTFSNSFLQVWRRGPYSDPHNPSCRHGGLLRTQIIKS
jgi:hypothetical protein